MDVYSIGHNFLVSLGLFNWLWSTMTHHDPARTLMRPPSEGFDSHQSQGKGPPSEIPITS